MKNKGRKEGITDIKKSGMLRISVHTCRTSSSVTVMQYTITSLLSIQSGSLNTHVILTVCCDQYIHCLYLVLSSAASFSFDT